MKRPHRLFACVIWCLLPAGCATPTGLQTTAPISTVPTGPAPGATAAMREISSLPPDLNRLAPPFAGAVVSRVYGLEEFEQALLAEKSRFLQFALEQVAFYRAQPELIFRDPNVPAQELNFKANAIMFRHFPTLVEWRKMKQQSLPGDQVVEFVHRDRDKYFDGPQEALNLGFALVRDGRTVQLVRVDSATFSQDY